MGASERRYEVHGTVTRSDGAEQRHRPKVIVWWQHIRRRSELASGHAAEDGAYCLTYRIPEDAVGRVLIVVEASASDWPAPVESPLTEAQPQLRIDLELAPRDRSELSTLLREIGRLIGEDDLEFTDLVENDDHRDISFLARELATDTETIMRVVVAVRLGEPCAIPEAVFYAFLRLNIPSALPSPLLEASQELAAIDALVRRVGSLIYALPPEVQRDALETAVARGLIAPAIADRIPEIVERLQALRTADVLTQPFVVGKTSLGALLETARLARDSQQAFAQALISNTASMRNFWRTLGDGQHGLTSAEASSVERTLSVGAFVKNHLPLLQLLLERFAAGALTSLHDLARLGQDDWIALVQQAGAPASVDAAGEATPEEVFARVVYARVTRAYPTAALATRIAASEIVEPGVRRSLDRFFTNNAALELRKTYLPAYLEQAGDKAWQDIAQDDRAAVLDHAGRMQRVLRVDPDVDIAHTLLATGLHSATHITRLGRQQFFVAATAAGRRTATPGCCRCTCSSTATRSVHGRARSARRPRPTIRSRRRSSATSRSGCYSDRRTTAASTRAPRCSAPRRTCATSCSGCATTG
jgi:hypothetical protein